MIAKRAREKKEFTGSYTGLAKYILRADKKESIATGWVTNCGFEDYPAAINEINAVQAMNTRGNENAKTYHLVVSFPAGEKPPLEILKAIETELCQKIGLGDHQRICAVHDDTDHYHLHIAINKVHPTTYNLIEPYYDKKKLVEAAKALEIKHGLRQEIDWDNPKGVKQAQGSEHTPVKVNSKGSEMESHTATQSFQGWVATQKPAIMEAIKTATDWQSLHKALAQFDLTFRKNANGLSLSSRTQKAYMKASDFDRSTTLKKLEDRYGAYQESTNDIKALPPALQYKPLPKQPPQGGLWETFQAAMASKQAIREANNEARKQSMDALYKAYTRRREMIKNDKVLNKRSKQATYQLLKQTYQNERKAAANIAKEKQATLLEQYPFRNWQDFLMNESLKGNEAALKTLRSNKVAEKLTERFAVWGEQAAKAALLFPALKPKIAKNGDILYRVGTINIRDNGRLHTNDDSGEAISLTLRLARQKYGNVLDVQGTDTFKRQVVECAAAEQMPVTFTDPHMEQYRQQLAQLAQQATKPQQPDQKQPTKPKDNDRGR